MESIFLVSQPPHFEDSFSHFISATYSPNHTLSSLSYKKLSHLALSTMIFLAYLVIYFHHTYHQYTSIFPSCQPSLFFPYYFYNNDTKALNAIACPCCDHTCVEKLQFWGKKTFIGFFSACYRKSHTKAECFHSEVTVTDL